jgi:type III secretion protein C
MAQKKTVTGDFDISQPYKFLEKFSEQVGLVWYDDGQTIYVYDNTELKNSVVILRYASLSSLNEFLQRTGLFSKRYPIRGEQKTGAFYVAGPPVYVDLVLNAATYLDDLYRNVDLNKQKISIIKLQHTFVGDRTFNIRKQEVKVAGIGKVIEAILTNEFNEQVTFKEGRSPKVTVGDDPSQLSAITKTNQGAHATGFPEKQVATDKNRLRVVAYNETNSLLVKGTLDQIQLIENLVAQLDVPKRHIELSLWVIDIAKDDLDRLGIDWQGAINIGTRGKVSFNGLTGTGTANFGRAGTATLDGNQFLAQITALNEQGIAQIVTRPIILTQDNVPAVFDNNETFYTKIQSERVASLESVTYGTLIEVLPRYSTAGEEIEMVLDIEDGQQSGAGRDSVVSGLPLISRTKISTVARVPKDKSLLIGGYTRDEYSNQNRKIPLLGNLPLVGALFRSTADTAKKKVRVYLIQPKLLDLGSIWNEQEFIASPMLNPESPLNDTVKALNRYSGADDGRY